MKEKFRWAFIYLVLCLLPFFFYFFPKNMSVSVQSIIDRYLFLIPYIGLGLIAILGLQINQTRIFWSALFFIAFFAFLFHGKGFTGTHTFTPPQIISAAFPVSLCFIFAMKESRLFSDKSLARLLLALSPFALLISLAYLNYNAYMSFLYWKPSEQVMTLGIPPLAWATTGLFLLVAMIQTDSRIKGFLVAQTCTLIPLLIVVQAHLCPKFSFDGVRPKAFITVVCFSVIAIVLLHAVFHTYWKKVYVDPLTSISNRQALDEQLHTLSGQYALAMVDIDHFKNFNDTYGHAEGDNVLRMVALHLKEQLGPRVYRYGGEEFCAIFEDHGAPDTEVAMDKVRSSLEKRKFVLRGHRSRRGEGKRKSKTADSSKNVKITISVGVSESNEKDDKETYEEVIKRADKALYRAKDKGRNCVMTER